MNAQVKFRLTVGLFGLGGAALLVELVRRHEGAVIVAAVAAAGWGVAAVITFHLLPLLADAVAWRALFPPQERPPLLRLMWMRWIGESVSTLLPVAQVGGDVVRARLANLRGVQGSTAAASVLLDITLSVFTQVIFTVTGLALLAVATKRFSAGPIVAGALLGLLAVGGFYAVQRIGIFRMIGGLVTRLSGDASWHSLVENCATLDRAVLDLYMRREGIVASTCATMSSWLLGAGEVWIALGALGISGQASQVLGALGGHLAGYLSALILESVGQGVRAATFFVPASLGLQEGGYLVVGGLLGIPPDAALALALIRRVREVAFGLPGLIGWQVVEARRAWQARAPQAT